MLQEELRSGIPHHVGRNNRQRPSSERRIWCLPASLLALASSRARYTSQEAYGRSLRASQTAEGIARRKQCTGSECVRCIPVLPPFRAVQMHSAKSFRLQSSQTNVPYRRSSGGSAGTKADQPVGCANTTRSFACANLHLLQVIDVQACCVSPNAPAPVHSVQIGCASAHVDLQT